MAKTRTDTRTGRNRGRKPPPRRRGFDWNRLLWPAIGLVAVAVAAFLILRPGGSDTGTPGEPVTGADLHSLVVDPENPSRVFVGGHTAVSVSTDGGATWRQVESLAGADAMGWAFYGQTVMVGGHPGLHVSTDGGRTFESHNDGLPSTDVHALGAGAGVIYGASPAAGVFASTDGGTTWEMRTTDAGQSFMGRILVDPADAEHLVAPDMQYGAVESVDGGRTWKQLGGVQGAMWVSWGPDDVVHLVVSAPGTAAVSRDGGTTWGTITVPDGASIVEMSPADPETMFAAAHDGSTVTISVSHDGGASWKRT
jgi:hypothetical protein